MGLIFGATVAGNHMLRMGTAGSGTAAFNIIVVVNDSIFASFGQGKLAASANDVLEVINGGSTCSYFITVWGTEE